VQSTLQVMQQSREVVLKEFQSRRRFAFSSLGAAAVLAGCGESKPQRRLKIGHTGITWGFKPENAPDAIRDVASLGYHSFESFGSILQAWEDKGGLDKILDENKLPLISAYCPVNLIDPAKRGEEVEKLVRWGKLIKKCGGSVAVIGPTSVKRDSFDFAASKPNLVAALNDLSKATADIGVVSVLHQHTGTCIETRDEVYSIMEAVDTKYVKFGPDVGQLQKGGADPVKIVSDFVSLIEHVHLKDFDGGPHYLGYCPLGQGKVNLAAILDLLEKSPIKTAIMVELDPSPNMPLTPLETARISKEYLEKAGYDFRA
jgi:inosose dehydratase